MGSSIGLLENLPSTEAFNSSDFMILGKVDFRILPILGIQRPPLGWGSMGYANFTGIWGGSYVNPINPCSNIVTEGWGVSFTNSTVHWGGSVNASLTDLP